MPSWNQPHKIFGRPRVKFKNENALFDIPEGGTTLDLVGDGELDRVLADVLKGQVIQHEGWEKRKYSIGIDIAEKGGKDESVIMISTPYYKQNFFTKMHQHSNDQAATWMYSMMGKAYSTDYINNKIKEKTSMYKGLKWLRDNLNDLKNIFNRVCNLERSFVSHDQLESMLTKNTRDLKSQISSQNKVISELNDKIDDLCEATMSAVLTNADAIEEVANAGDIRYHEEEVKPAGFRKVKSSFDVGIGRDIENKGHGHDASNKSPDTGCGLRADG